MGFHSSWMPRIRCEKRGKGIHRSFETVLLEQAPPQLIRGGHLDIEGSLRRLACESKRPVGLDVRGICKMGFPQHARRVGRHITLWIVANGLFKESLRGLTVLPVVLEHSGFVQRIVRKFAPRPTRKLRFPGRESRVAPTHQSLHHAAAEQRRLGQRGL